MSYRVGSDTKKCAVGPGFVEAGPDKVAILTDEYIEREGIDPVLGAKGAARGPRADERRIGKSSDPANEEIQLLVRRENWLAAQLELYGNPPPATMRPFETWAPPRLPRKKTSRSLPTTPARAP